MAKKKSLKGKGTYAAYKAESRAEKNKAAKLARHLRKHPNDEQAEKAVGKPHNYRKAPRGGSAVEPTFYLLNEAGHKLPMPLFTHWRDL